MRFRFVLAILALAGCQRGGVRAVLGDVEVSTGALHFESTFIGHPSTRILVLRNVSRADRSVSLSTQSPFTSPSALTVPGGSQLEVEVRFDPLEPGSATGTLALSDGRNDFEVRLYGEGVRAPICAASAACQTSIFDPASGACVESVAADGAACTSDNACFLKGTCARGLCLGSVRDCSDADRCTVDACDPAGGCLHLPTRCAAPENPCKVALCDSALGCIENDATDGTACGPADCATAQVCLSGECKSRPVPDGATCAPATACQGAGICQHQVCERPAATPLVEAWHYDFPGLVSGFRGVTDSAENLYWVECAYGGLFGNSCDACTRCAATSFTRDGVLRFRQILPGFVGFEQQPLHLIAGSQLIFALPYRIGAVALADGAPVWNRDFYAPLPNAPDAANFLEVKAMVSDPTSLYLLAERYQISRADPRQNALLKLDPSNGSVTSTRFFDGTLTGAVVDELNNLYLGFVPRPGADKMALPPELISFSPSGAERWRVALPPGIDLPVAVYRSEVLLKGGEVRSTLDGTRRVDAPQGRMVHNALLGAQSRTLLIDPPVPCCPSCPCPVPIPRINAINLKPGSPHVDWEASVAMDPGGTIGIFSSDSVATRKGDLLVAGASGLSLTHLIALDTSGAQRFSCDIPGSAPSVSVLSRYDSPVALIAGRWAVVEDIECPVCLANPSPRLRVFEVPGEGPTLHGWVGAYGSPTGGSRPLP